MAAKLEEYLTQNYQHFVHRRKDRQTERLIPIYPKKHSFCVCVCGGGGELNAFADLGELNAFADL